MSPETEGLLPEQSTGVSGVRASNQDREAVVLRLHAAVGEGCLELEEAEQRMTRAYAARWRDQLAPLLTDLPERETAPQVAIGWAPLWSAVVGQARALWTGRDAATASAASPTIGVHGHPTTRHSVVVAVGLVVALLWLALWVLVGFAAGAMG